MWFALLSLLAIPLGYYLFIELKGYLKIMRYKKQGIKHIDHYTIPGVFYKTGKIFGSDDPSSESKKVMGSQDPNQPFRVMNFGSTCLVSLISEKAIKEFYAQETEVALKENPVKNFKFMGFIMENGKEVQEKRALFAKIFHYSNILRLMPLIRNEIKKHVLKLKKRVSAEGGQVKIDLKKEFSQAVFEDLTGCILLAGAENKIHDTFEGMNFTQIIHKMVLMFNDSLITSVKLIPFASELGLIKEEKEMRRLKKGLVGIIRKEYNKRYNQESLSDLSALDIMVKLNKESEKETGKAKFDVEEIASNFELFHFAASDTSFHLSTATLSYLALPENQKYQKRIYKQIGSEIGTKANYSNDELNSLKDLNNAFREAARLANPATEITRTATKDFKLDGYTIFKGDVVTNILTNYEPEHFKNPLKFNPDRFDTAAPDFKRAPKLKQTTFSHGQRACLGKYLGEMMVKLIVVELLKEFEVSVEPSYGIKFGRDPLFTVMNPDLIMKVRTTSE